MHHQHTRLLGLACIATQPAVCLQMVMKRQRSNYRRSSSGHSNRTKADDVATDLQSQESDLFRIWSGLEHRDGSEGSAGPRQETSGSVTSRQSSLSGRQSSLSSRGSLTRTTTSAGENTEPPCPAWTTRLVCRAQGAFQVVMDAVSW